MGLHSAGVKRQYCGQLGKTDNCQVGVFGKGFIDYTLGLIPSTFKTVCGKIGFIAGGHYNILRDTNPYESDELNEKVIQSEKAERRFKLFDYNDNELIACYTFRESSFSNVGWSKEYE